MIKNVCSYQFEKGLARQGSRKMENLVRTEIKDVFLRVFARETEGQEPPEITDDLVLLETGLDSLGFAILVVELEEEMGFDPFTLSDEAYYPQTFGEFVTFYEANKP